MWNFASNAIGGAFGLKNDRPKLSQPSSCNSDDDISLTNSREERLECPICWESFNIVENVPYVLWCGHTLCKNCVLALHSTVTKFPTLPVKLPFFISCPWCNLLSFRLVYRGNLKFPRKNFFLLWMVESLNGDRSKSSTSHCGFDHQPVLSLSKNIANPGLIRRRTPLIQPLEPSNSDRNESGLVVNYRNYFNLQILRLSLRKSLVFFVHLMVKFPLMVIFLLIVLYAIPACAAFFALYILVTILFALPSFLVLYFSLPVLNWLISEILN